MESSIEELFNAINNSDEYKEYKQIVDIIEEDNDIKNLIEEIKKLMQDYKHRIRSEHPKIYSQDLLNNLFKHPYTKIEFLERDLTVLRKTAAKYLESLSESGFLEKVKIGRSNFYINRPLFNLFKDGVKRIQTEERIKTVTQE